MRPAGFDYATRDQQASLLQLAILEGRVDGRSAARIAREELGFSEDRVERLTRNPIADAMRRIGLPKPSTSSRAAKRPEAALAALKVTEVGEIPGGWIEIGARLDQNREYAAARAAFNQVPKTGNGDHADAVTRIGLTYHHEARDARLKNDRRANALERRAIDSYLKAFRLDRTDDSPLYNMACSEIARGGLDRARHLLYQCVEVAIDTAKAEKRRGVEGVLDGLRATLALVRGDDELAPLRGQMSKTEWKTLEAWIAGAIRDLDSAAPRILRRA